MKTEWYHSKSWWSKQALNSWLWCKTWEHKEYEPIELHVTYNTRIYAQRSKYKTMQTNYKDSAYLKVWYRKKKKDNAKFYFLLLFLSYFVWEYLRDASAKSHALKKLMETQCCYQRLDCLCTFRSTKRYSNYHWMDHDSQLQNLYILGV